MANPTAFFRNYCSIVTCMHGELFVCLFCQCTCVKTTKKIMSRLIHCPCDTSPIWKISQLFEAPRGYMIYSPRAAHSVNKSHISSLPQNNPYLLRCCGLKRTGIFASESKVIYRMQIWRTTPSSPGTSCMKLRPRCFVLTMLPLKSLASWTF